MQYFSSNIVEGVAESWVEAEMSWVEVDGAGWSNIFLQIPLKMGGNEEDFESSIF